MDTTCLSDPVHQKIRKPIMTGSGGKPKDTRSATGGSDKKMHANSIIGEDSEPSKSEERNKSL